MKKTFIYVLFLLVIVLTVALSVEIISLFLPQNTAESIYNIRESDKVKRSEIAQGKCTIVDEKQQISNPINKDPIELKKQAWANLLANHPYTKRENTPNEEWKKVPKKDRPDLAMEQNFLMTMDPALGDVPSERIVAAHKYASQLLSNKVAIPGVTWQERGPNNVGGRTRAVMFDPNDATNKKVWAGGVGGGIWVTNDITAANPVWSRNDDFWADLAISSIAYNPANTQEFYVGTGEGWYNADAVRGRGIWKSTDGGSTWNQLAITDPGAYNSGSDWHYIQKIVIKNNGIIFAATRGYFVNRGGIMRSTDGGVTWTKVLTVYTGAGALYDWAADIEVAANGDVYASFGIFSDCKVFKSTNANNGAAGTWVDLSANVGIAASTIRIELACAPSDANIIYAVGASSAGGNNDVAWFKKSVNAGTNWNAITIPLMVDGTGNHYTRAQSWYDLILKVHPTNPSCVLAGGIDLHRTTDGGTSWTGISHWYGGFSKPYVHADQHGMQFRPGANNEMIFANDGGVYYSPDAGNTAATPTFLDQKTTYNTTQFYACAALNQVNSNYFLAGAQDNGSKQFLFPQIGSAVEVTGGDGAFCHIDQLNPNIQSTAYTYNTIYRSLNGGLTFAQISNEVSGHFINPSEYDSQRKILYSAGNNNVLKRFSGFDAVITTTNLGINVGAARVSALKMSTYSDLLVLGVENGRIYTLNNASTGAPTLTRIDNGATPITATGWVSSVDIGANNNQIMVTYSNYGVTSVWETTNGGTNWYSKEGNLPDMPIRWALYNPDDRNQVLVATEVGVWSTNDFQPGTANAPTWGPTNTNLANARCDMLKYRSADKMVVVATHGRGLFTTDIFVTTTVADFIANPNVSCTGTLNANFIDGSLRPNGSWAWDIDNNGSTDYTIQNPVHTYNSPGLYSVKLTVNFGGATTTKTNYILVMNSAPTTCSGCALAPNSNLNNDFGIGISRFALGSIDNRTSYNDGYYQDYACSQWTLLSLNTLYNVSITTGTLNAEGARVYIDYNDNGTFEAGELMVSFPANTTGARTLSFTTPAAGVVMDKGLRMRVLSRFSSIPTGPCDISTYGQAEDYTVYFWSNPPLPISLVSFSAVCKNGRTNLQWITASEVNNDYFTVERSGDGIDFTKIAKIKGSGSSNQTISYSYEDDSGASGLFYYRLKQTDYDGAFTYSGVVANQCNDITEILIYPNPSRGIFTISGMDELAEITITNTTGEVVYTSKGLNASHSIDISSQPDGVYQLFMSRGSWLKVIRIVVIH
jgi:PKD repeat protein